ncbi:MAG TPA: DUF2339 domain-containing protein [Thermoanaerobaculia bacterium]|jgi:uncharacterized membrane protein|nr:DUF2339 domain-containing protein [Thermoanaerobaculia bacterium]
MASDEDIAEIRKRLAMIEQRLGIVWNPDETPRPSLDASRLVEETSAPPVQALETRIGAHWLNRVGIAAVLFGAAFFLKYAFDNDWVGPSMRVTIGAAVGIALLGWAELLRARGHELFAHSLDVLGAGILYLTIWAASEMYTLVSGGAAFGAMIAVTAIVVGLGLRHRSQFLAGVALTGGFMTPILLSTGGDHETSLFTYVALLDLAAVVLLVLHPWLRALSVAFVGTLVLYIGWAADHYSDLVMTRTIGFATLFFLLFAIVPLLRRWDVDPPSQGVLVLPFANALVYFGQLTRMIGDTPDRLAWYALALAALFLVIAGAMKLAGVRRDDIAAAHLALAIGFITVALPLKLNERWITIGWLAESAALFAIAPRLSPARARVFRILGTVALIGSVFRLLVIDKFTPHYVLLNWRMLSYAMAIAIFAMIAYRQRGTVWQLVVSAGNALAVIALTLEANRIHADIARNFTRSAIWMAYGAALMFAGFHRHLAFLRWLALLLIGITVAKVFLFDINALERIYRIASFIGLGVLLLAISFAYQKKWITMEDGGVAAERR